MYYYFTIMVIFFFFTSYVHNIGIFCLLHILQNVDLAVISILVIAVCHWELL